MYILMASCRSRTFSSYTRFITFQIKQWLALVVVTLILTLAGTAQAAPFFIGLSIENNMDSNGNITVINGSKVKVAYMVDDPDKFLNKADKIQLRRVSDDSVVSSLTRGKKKSGTVLLKVKNSQNEQLYVGYVRKGETDATATYSHPDNAGHIPLLSIPKAGISDLTKGLNAVESAPPPYQPAHYSEMFVDNVAATSSECANWNAFRASLVPSNYTCVQFLGSAGKGATSCDGTAVSELATALRDGTSAAVSIDGTDWRVRRSGVAQIRFGTSSHLGTCAGPTALRPCIGNANWGGIGDTTCSGNDDTTPSQSMTIIFR